MKVITVIFLIFGFSGIYPGIEIVSAKNLNTGSVNSVVDDSFTDPVPFPCPSPKPQPWPDPAPGPDPIPLPDIVEPVGLS